MDPALSDLGHAQAAISAANFFHSLSSKESTMSDVVISSRLRRAKQTAEWSFEAMKFYIPREAETGTKSELPLGIEVEVSDPILP